MPFFEFGRRSGESPAAVVGAPQDAEWGPVVPYPDAGVPDIQVVGPIRDGMRLMPNYAVIPSGSQLFGDNFKFHTGASFEILGEVSVLTDIPNANISLTLQASRKTGPGQHRVKIGVRRVDVVPEEIFFDSGNVNADEITFFRNNVAIPAGRYVVTVEDGSELISIADGWTVLIEER